MKQTLTVRALIKHENKLLLVRRVQGRETLKGLYELVGGEIAFGEAPELAMRRKIAEVLGLETQTIQLHDVISELDAENTSLQRIAIIYNVSLTPGGIELGYEHDKYIWREMSNLQLYFITSITALVLGLAHFGGVIEVKSHTSGNIDARNATTSKAIIYCDGGSRGNPGPSASGYIIMNERNEVVFEGGVYLGTTDSNQAEYQAVKLALEKALGLGIREVECRLDSQLVVNQMRGQYKIKNAELQRLHDEMIGLVYKFKNVHFNHIPRELNHLADGLVNKILDAQSS